MFLEAGGAVLVAGDGVLGIGDALFDNFTACVPPNSVADAVAGTLVAKLPKGVQAEALTASCALSPRRRCGVNNLHLALPPFVCLSGYILRSDRHRNHEFIIFRKAQCFLELDGVPTLKGQCR